MHIVLLVVTGILLLLTPIPSIFYSAHGGKWRRVGVVGDPIRFN